MIKKLKKVEVITKFSEIKLKKKIVHEELDIQEITNEVSNSTLSNKRSKNNQVSKHE